MNENIFSAPSVSIRHAYLSFNGTILFDDLHLDLLAGKCTCLLGPSGIGKSTLLRLIATLYNGENSEREKIITHAEISADNNIPISEQIAYMAQTDLLLPWFSVIENVLLAPRLKNSNKIYHKDLQARAKLLLTQMGLEKFLDFYPHQLSGGMRQRVALARTFLENKSLILMDEPFSAIDAITRYKLQNISASYLKNKTVLFITHDPLEALRLADIIYIMSGKPASLKMQRSLTSTTPRDLHSSEVIREQASLFESLSDACGESV